MRVAYSFAGIEQRIAAVRTLEALDFTYRNGDWLAADARATPCRSAQGQQLRQQPPTMAV